jgi:hypothetical protein
LRTICALVATCITADNPDARRRWRREAEATADALATQIDWRRRLTVPVREMLEAQGRRPIWKSELSG